MLEKCLIFFPKNLYLNIQIKSLKSNMKLTIFRRDGYAADTEMWKQLFDRTDVKIFGPYCSIF